MRWEEVSLCWICLKYRNTHGLQRCNRVNFCIHKQSLVKYRHRLSGNINSSRWVELNEHQLATADKHLDVFCTAPCYNWANLCHWYRSITICPDQPRYRWGVHTFLKLHCDLLKFMSGRWNPWWEIILFEFLLGGLATKKFF